VPAAMGLRRKGRRLRLFLVRPHDAGRRPRTCALQGRIPAAQGSVVGRRVESALFRGRVNADSVSPPPSRPRPRGGGILRCRPGRCRHRRSLGAFCSEFVGLATRYSTLIYVLGRLLKIPLRTAPSCATLSNHSHLGPLMLGFATAPELNRHAAVSASSRQPVGIVYLIYTVYI